MTRILHATVLSLAVLTALPGCNLSDDPQTLIAKAQDHRQKNDYKAAVIELKNVLVKNPEQAEARYVLGVTYNDLGDFKSAEKELRKALELQYDRTKAIPALGRTLLLQGQFQKVVDEAKLEGDAPAAARAEVLTLRAEALLGMGRMKEGSELLAQAVALQPDLPDALLVQARLAAGDKKPDAAQKLVERVIASHPKNIDAWLLKGDLGRLTNDPAAARAAYAKVLEIRPDNVPAHLNLAVVDINERKFGEARKQVAEVRKTYPNHLMALYMQSLIEFREGKYGAARDAAMQVLKIAPDHIPSLMVAGSAEFALGSHVQAQAHLERLLNDMPDNLEARKLLISSLAKTGQVTRAMDLLKPALLQSPADASLMALAGDLYMQSNDYAAATRYFEMAAKQDPKSVAVRTRLGQSRFALGETDRALADLESAVQMDAADYQADVALVVSYLSQSKYDLALKALKTLEEKQPNNPLTYNLKGSIYVGKKDTASARKQLAHALELQPTYIPAATNLAILDLRDKNPQAARGRFESILSKDKDNVQALLSLANFGQQIGATDKEQLDWLQRAAKASPNAAQPRLMLARFHARNGEPKKALEAAQQAQTVNPDNPEVLDALGSAQINAGQQEQAVRTYSKLASLQPDSPAVLQRLAVAQAANNNSLAATATLKKALALKPDFVPALVSLADLEMRAGRHAEALRIAHDAQKQKPKSGAGYVLEGDVLMAQKKYTEAAQAYEKAFGKDRNGVIAIKLHAAYARAGNVQEADARLAQWLKESPEDVAVRTYAAETSLTSGKWARAIEQYQWLQQKYPQNVVILNNLAWAYQQAKDPRALETAEHAYKLKPDNAAAADTLGWILVERGDASRGLELLDKASGAAPESATIRYHLAQAALKAGDKTRARRELERLLASKSSFPQESDARDLLNQLSN